MRTDGKHEGTPPQGEDDALWRLLERAPRPGPVSPYFARRVLREVAAFEKDRPAAGGAANWLARVRRAWRRTPGAAWAGALAVAVLLAAGGTQFYPRQAPAPAPAAVPAPESASSGSVAEVSVDPSPAAAATAKPAVTAQDVEVIADLDNVLSREESRLWTEDDTARY